MSFEHSGTDSRISRNGIINLQDHYSRNIMDHVRSRNTSTQAQSSSSSSYTYRSEKKKIMEYQRSVSQGRRILPSSYFSLESLLLLICLTASLLILPLILPPLPPPPFLLLLLPIAIMVVKSVLVRPVYSKNLRVKYRAGLNNSEILFDRNCLETR
ncbi:protein AUXIN-REGULATED GENE INVOLVED IN ORGAN SIZE-like [Mercurialis annua]|uniref:protein AUXIN-REGULATED GENE INVOLVED IN ORGAN SIZE-like n=1 Tax=Mercurialis annua TaxID=3986 RepID=UPI00215FD671|nr:protein AUXIN-REGULATED GENE INVOLVED IN ORGAN SIZE-like [Mercurialis annua]